MVDDKYIIGKLRENISQIKKYGVKRIALFGSYIRGEAHKGSDIDILVVFEKGKKTFDNYMDLKFFLEDLFGSKIDLVILESVRPELQQEILSTMKYVS